MRDSLTGSSTIATKYLCSIADVVNYVDYLNLKNNSSSISITSSVTSILQSYIGIISQAFEMAPEVQGPLKTQNFNGFYDGTGCDTLYLAKTPLQSVSSILFRSTPTSAWTSVTSTVLVYRNKIKLYNDVFAYGSQNYKINYFAGYLDEELECLKQPTIEEVALMFYESRKQGEARLGISNKTLPVNPGENIGFNSQAVYDRHRKLLLPFRKGIVV